ncbi:hypothetical protein [Trabulsiella odontotermitis]|uniref:HTH luxR-type domain-containing protein n=1 Tax=Trabulsiella odontotermitis TaxID=379893 RepID=A0A0L0H1F0_9ENTR|nr:hypothetical protein [Trabulsiella odontotermitis]KNC94824.1 hypothetical protein GM31_12435 [Trabulsiella odontotermitis]
MYLIINGHKEYFAVPGNPIARTHCPPLPDVPLRETHYVTGELSPDDAPGLITTLLWYLYLVRQAHPKLNIRVSDSRINDACQPLLSALGLQPAADMAHDHSHYLTRCEARVLLLLLGGLSVTQVSELLCRDIRTVSTQKVRAIAKAGLEHNGDLHLLGAQLYGRSPVRRPPLSLDDYAMISVIALTGHVSHTAVLLGMPERTVSRRKQVIMKKLGVEHDVALYAALGLSMDRKKAGKLKHKIAAHIKLREGQL